jgi:cytochrome P450
MVGSRHGEEVIGMTALMCVGGTETTSGFTANSLFALAEHPDRRALLA